MRRVPDPVNAIRALDIVPTNDRNPAFAFAAALPKRYRQGHRETPCPLKAPSAAPGGQSDQDPEALHANDPFDIGNLQLMSDRAATSPTVATIPYRDDRTPPTRSCAGPVVSCTNA